MPQMRIAPTRSNLLRVRCELALVQEGYELLDEKREALIKELADNGRRYLAAEKVLREGTPHIEIVNEARKQTADLIVMGQVGRRGPRRILIGSVAERVIEYAECPVLITKKER
jgi:nucleotide-binding universal stress UspA family protein